MKTRIIIGIVLLLLVMVLCPLSVRADSQNTGLDPEELDFGEVDELLQSTEAEKLLRSQTEDRTVGQLLKAVVSGDEVITWQEWIGAFGNALWGNLKRYVGLMLQIVGLVLISQLFGSMNLHFGEGSAGEVGFLCVYGVMVLLLIESFQLAYDETKETVENVRNLSMYMMPAMAAVAVAGGFPISSIMHGEILTGGFSLILTVIKNVFITAALWITVLEVVNLISKRAVLTQLTQLGRTVLEKGLKAICALYLMIMGIMGAVTPAADRMVYKVSNTLISAIPVVGSAMSGAMDSVMAGSVLIKNGIGAVSCIVLLCICLIPVAKLAAFWLMYRLIAAFLAPLADDRVIKLLSALGRSSGMLLGMLVSSMVIFTGAVGIMVVTLGR